MRVTLEPARDHQAIFDDDDFKVLVEHAGRSESMLQFIAAVIRSYRTHGEVVHGKRGSNQNAESFANRFFKGTRSRRAGVEIARLFARLYASFDPGTVRGCLIESMVEGRLRVRYAGGQLENNVFVALSNGTGYRTSSSV